MKIKYKLNFSSVGLYQLPVTREESGGREIRWKGRKWDGKLLGKVGNMTG